MLSVGVIASPASAHIATLNGDTHCDNGQHVVVWTVINDFASIAHLEGVRVTPGTVDLPVDIPAKQGDVNGTITATQRFAGTETVAKLTIDKIKWDDRAKQADLSKVVDLGGPCAPPPPPSAPPECVKASDAKYSHELDGAKGEATIKLKEGSKPLCEGKRQSFALASYLAPQTTHSPELLFDSDTGTITSDKRQIKLKVKVPPCSTKIYLVWNDDVYKKVDPAKGYGNRVLGSKEPQGSRSEGKLGVYTGGTGECGDKPKVDFADSCKGVDINLSNRGLTAADFFGESKVGTEPFKPFDKPVTVKPGKTASMFVKGVPGVVVRIISGASLNVEHKWVAPADCTPPTPGPTPSPPGGPSTPNLPTTGASLTIMTVSALALLGSGIGLMYFTRRKRLAATANGVDDPTTALPGSIA